MWWVSTSTSSSSTLPLVQHDVVHGIVAQVLLRVDVEVLLVLRVHLTTPVPEENWHVKLILCFQSLALRVKKHLDQKMGSFFQIHPHLVRVDIEVLQVLRVHLTTPNWHVWKLIFYFQCLALG